MKSPHRGRNPAPSVRPNGLAFEIADLILASSWAERYDFRMAVYSDHGAVVDEDYEEVIVFQAQTFPFWQCLLWRSVGVVCVQPRVGKARRYTSIAEALDGLIPDQGVVLTDISAIAERPERI